MTDFHHDPTTDHDDDVTVSLTDGYRLHLCPTCLSVHAPGGAGAAGAPIARVPLNLDHILGVAGGETLVAHATHGHTLTVQRADDGLHIRVRTAHQLLREHHLPLPARAA